MENFQKNAWKKDKYVYYCKPITGSNLLGSKIVLLIHQGQVSSPAG